MIGKFYIVDNHDEWCLAEFDHSKYPSTEIIGGAHDGCYNTPDSWLESPDPEDGAMLFDTKYNAQKIIDLLKADPINEDLEYFILKVEAPVIKTLELSPEQLKSVISTLQCTLNRQSQYGSFGDDDTIFDSFAIEKAIRQLSA